MVYLKVTIALENPFFDVDKTFFTYFLPLVDNQHIFMGIHEFLIISILEWKARTQFNALWGVLVISWYCFS